MTASPRQRRRRPSLLEPSRRAGASRTTIIWLALATLGATASGCTLIPDFDGDSGAAVISPSDAAGPSGGQVVEEADPAPTFAGGDLDVAAAADAADASAPSDGQTFSPIIAGDGPLELSGEGGLFTPIVKVNDEIITGYDVQQRATLLRFASGGQIDGDVERLALEELVSDAIKIQEAERLGIEVTEEAFGEALAAVAQANGSSVDGMFATLREAGVDRETFERQLLAQLVWNRILRERFGDRLQPTDAEIDAALEEAEPGPSLYRLAQIVVPVVATAPEATVREAYGRALAARERITNCSAIESAAASIGLQAQSGRLPRESMPGPIRDAIAGLSSGETTEPLRSGQGFHLITFCGIEEGQPPSRELIEQQLLQVSVDRFSGSLLDELRRTALIEVR